MDIKTKAANAVIEDTSTGAEEFPGTFEVVLSTPRLDRDGDTLQPDEWELPLPDSITFVNDHAHMVKSIVGSAKPTIEGGKMVCRGTWAETGDAQDTRKLVRGKHLTHTSVAYREKRDRKSGSVSRELLNGSFVVVPSNVDAKVLAAKSFEGEDTLTDETKAFLEEVVVKAMHTLESVTRTGSVLPAGFTATTDLDTSKSVSTLTIKDADGKTIVSHEFPASTTKAPSKDADPAADTEDREKALALAKANLSQFQTTSLVTEGN